MHIVWVLFASSYPQFSGLTYATQQECQYYASKLGGTCSPMSVNNQPATPTNPLLPKQYCVEAMPGQYACYPMPGQ